MDVILRRSILVEDTDLCKGNLKLGAGHGN
jgi:hypothetical protein